MKCVDKFDTIIEPGRSLKNYWIDLWKYRELFFFLSWRDVLVRYKQTVIGVAWSLIRPLLTMVVFTIIFGNIAKLPSNGVPYPILVFSAMLPWQFFANSLSECSGALIANSSMLTKVYFPRLIMPSSAVIVSIVDFMITFVMLLILMIWYHFIPSWRIFMLPFFLLLALIPSLGIGLLLSALNVKYRDFRYIVPFIVQFGLYISPVGFSSNVVPEQWRFIYSVNPMVGVIDGFRWAILGGDFLIYWPGFILSCLLSIIFLILGVRYFRKMEFSFADVI